MTFVATGFLISSVTVIALWTLFHYEERAGVRIGERARTHADFAVIKITHFFNNLQRFFGRDLFRQIFHYIFHTFLRVVLLGVKKCELTLRSVMKVNKSLAKSAEREGETLSKLEEIALHKVATTLTDEEKQKHKDRVLRGN